jgi:lysophospholipase L1-like esterase
LNIGATVMDADPSARCGKGTDDAKETPMKRSIFLTLAAGLAGVAVFAAEKPKVRPLPASMPAVKRTGETVVKETWDWAKAMIPVASRSTGKPGMIVCLGDSLTYANQSTRWAWSVPWNRKGEYTDSDKAILRWSHAYEQDKPANGWWLAKVDRPGGRSETAASGITTAQYLRGGFHGLPSLAEILKKYDPKVAFILLGSNDARGRKPDDVLKDMNTIVEMVLNNGTVPVLTTLPPARSERMHNNIKQINARYLSLAAARKIPIIDLYGEFVSRRPEGAWKNTLVGPDGVHLTYALADGPPTEENLKSCGYLLRCWLTVQKLKQVKEKVIDKAKGKQ